MSIDISYGFGFNYYSPIGPIGFSWGFPLVDKDYDISQLDYIGFDEIASYLIGNISLDEASEKIIIRTRQYAKRQLKWFDAQQFDIVVDADNINSDDMVDKIAQIC